MIHKETWRARKPEHTNSTLWRELVMWVVGLAVVVGAVF